MHHSIVDGTWLHCHNDQPYWKWRWLGQWCTVGQMLPQIRYGLEKVGAKKRSGGNRSQKKLLPCCMDDMGQPAHYCIQFRSLVASANDGKLNLGGGEWKNCGLGNPTFLPKHFLSLFYIILDSGQEKDAEGCKRTCIIMDPENGALVRRATSGMVAWFGPLCPS